MQANPAFFGGALVSLVLVREKYSLGKFQNEKS